MSRRLEKYVRSNLAYLRKAQTRLQALYAAALDAQTAEALERLSDELQFTAIIAGQTKLSLRVLRSRKVSSRAYH